MAGTGSRGPAAKDASTRQRRNKTSSKAVLSTVTDHDVPSLPNPQSWFGIRPDDDNADLFPGLDEEGNLMWPLPVQQWWTDIWKSPMSNEFVHSDIQGLYLAAFYLAQALNPFAKINDRLTAGSKHESCVRNYGLNPMARRTLQWEIERTEEAQDRGRKRRSRATTQESKPAAAPDPRGDEEGQANPFSVVS